ncbi:MAG: hypothetical protein M3Y56_02105, partial [Armatimonadota bacterium]|nr:hypothetical protein [Armatimonadota bacterium]
MNKKRLRFAGLTVLILALAALAARYFELYDFNPDPKDNRPVYKVNPEKTWSAQHRSESAAPTGAAAIGNRGSAHVQFVNTADQAGLHYAWHIDGPRPMDILQTIGNGCAFLDYNNDGNLDILLIGPTLALYKGDGHGHF